MVWETLFRVVAIGDQMQWGTEIGFNIEYSKDRWEIVGDKQKERGQWMENY